MKEKFWRLLFCMSLFISCQTSYVKYDSYVGDIDSVIHRLGNKFSQESYVVNSDYSFKSEIEPNYFDYFSENEKKTDVTVNVYRWKKMHKTIVVWSKESDGKLKVFSSVEYTNDINF